MAGPQHTPTPESGHVLVAGSTGYVGRRLVPELLAAGWQVRCMARRPEELDAELWRDQVEVVHGDVLDPPSLVDAFRGVTAAYYLIHSIGVGDDWRERDRRAARNFSEAAASAGTEQIVYLGGLGDERGGELSPHLESRHEVGTELACAGVAVTELRAAVVIGSGSASFEMLRHLTEVLPAMVCPKWVDTRCQPIGIRDLLVYAVGVLGNPGALGQVVEVGGADVLTYREMMDTYAEEAGLRRRLIVPVPLLSPRLSSLWIGLVTPLPPSLARPLVDSLVNEVVVTDDLYRRLVPHQPMTYRETVERALHRVADLDVSTTWADALLYGQDPAAPMSSDPDWSGGTLLEDLQEAESAASPGDLFATLEGVGGSRGWPVVDWMWKLRGLLDQLVGGIGMRRGRR
ncbi:MAG: NAD(P)H-binding protein, partial [Microthrixaceae bacterium]